MAAINVCGVNHVHETDEGEENAREEEKLRSEVFILKHVYPQLVDGEGFEPSDPLRRTDLQSVCFNHLHTHPFRRREKGGDQFLG